MISFDTEVAENGATVIEATGRLDVVAAPQLKAVSPRSVRRRHLSWWNSARFSSWTPPGWVR